jgi:ATP-dependent Lon protease
MKESINIAYTYLKCNTEKYRLSPSYFNNYDIHIHVPEGAIKKDGPSAGVTMTTAIYSLITNQIIKPKLAMTGELSLMGKVMPIGGLKEKVLAAKRNKIKEIIIPKQNKKDLDKLDPKVTKGIVFHIVEDVSQVLEIAFPNDKDAIRPTVEQKDNNEQVKLISAAVSNAVKEALRG